MSTPVATSAPTTDPATRTKSSGWARNTEVRGFTMKALQELSARMTTATSLDRLLDSILGGMKEFFGFSHSMILLAGEKSNTLVTIASRGYPSGGAGSEVLIPVGVVVGAHGALRLSGLCNQHGSTGTASRTPRATVLRRAPRPGKAWCS